MFRRIVLLILVLVASGALYALLAWGNREVPSGGFRLLPRFGQYEYIDLYPSQPGNVLDRLNIVIRFSDTDAKEMHFDVTLSQAEICYYPCRATASAPAPKCMYATLSSDVLVSCMREVGFYTEASSMGPDLTQLVQAVQNASGTEGLKTELQRLDRFRMELLPSP